MSPPQSLSSCNCCFAQADCRHACGTASCCHKVPKAGALHSTPEMLSQHRAPARCSLAGLHIGSSSTAAMVCRMSGINPHVQHNDVSFGGDCAGNCASIVEPRSGPGYQIQDMRCVVTERGQTVDQLEGIDPHMRDWPVLLSCGLQGDKSGPREQERHLTSGL